MTHIVVLCRSIPLTSDETVMRPDYLASEECCQVWVSVGKVRNVEVA
jgi:hypothetical protein